MPKKAVDVGESYIKLFRKITEWEWFDDPNMLKVFIYLLVKANYIESSYKGHLLPVGSLVIGRKALAEKLKLSEQQIRTSLDKLKKSKEVTIKATNKFSILTIEKYSEYQYCDTKHNQQVTNNQPTSNQQVTTSKEGKKVRREEEPKTNKQTSFDLFWSEYPKKKNKGTAERAWKRLRLGNGTLTSIMKGLESAKLSGDWQRDNGQYIPYPSTWLNARGWEDEQQVATTKPQRVAL